MSKFTPCSYILVLVLSSVTANSQLAPEFSRLFPDVAVVDSLQRLEWTAAGDHFDPAQSVSAGGRGRHTSSYTLDATWKPAGDVIYQWNLDVHYPFPSNYQYSETLQPSGTGTFAGADGFRPSPSGALVPARAGARMKFLWMGAPALLLNEAHNVSPESEHSNSYLFDALDTSWVVQLDSETGLPAALSTLEDDPLFGLAQTSVEYSSWQNVDGIMVPARLEYRVDGNLIRRELRSSINAVLGQPLDRPAYSQALSIPRYSLGWNQAHWFISRIALGSPRDEDQSQPVEFLQVAEGVYQVHGNSHHNLLIELENGLVVVDAPMYPARSEAVLKALVERWPNKPVQHLILTHHHYDHSGGLATYAAAGIPITMHSLNRDFFVDAFVQQGIANSDIRGVGDKTHIEVGGRAINLYEIPTTHADGLLGVYLPDAKLLLIADIYSPGQGATNPLWDTEALNAIHFLNKVVPIEHVVGVHGSGAHTLSEVEMAINKKQ